MKVTVVGSGYVGLTTGACLAAAGHDVTCVDVDPARVAAVEARRAPFYEPGLAELLGSDRLHASTDLVEAARASEVIMIAVGTPESASGVDLSFIGDAASAIGESLRGSSRYHVIAVKSTVPPGTTDVVVCEAVEAGSGLEAGQFGLAMNPEFLRQGSAVADSLHPDRIVVGHSDERTRQVMAELYGSHDCPIVFTSIRNAELAKYASNALLATLVSFSNEIASICEATPETDVRRVMEILHLDRRWSPLVDGKRIEPGILGFLWAGCGFGGSCLPKDVNGLRAYARAVGVEPALLDATAAINESRPALLVRLAEHELGSLSDADVAVIGLAFKPGTDDLRRSPALEVIDGLRVAGAAVRGYDPIVTAADGVDVTGSIEEALAGADAAIVVSPPADAGSWDWPRLCNSMRRRLVIDGRGTLAGLDWPQAVRYLTVGRVNA
jgi:UDPglucose 6-dehydrogenase/GDP-mannose 6-dehydrogenase